MNAMDAHQNTLTYINDFELYDFVHNPNFDQFINLIRGEDEDANCDFGSDLINDCFVNNQLLSCPTNPFDQNNNNAVSVYDPSSTFSSFSCFDGEVKGHGEEEHDGEHSSETTTTTTMTTKNGDAKPKLKTDRSKTLISERRRRGRMKEKLYALRSLVPNITKMDKASIIGDAVSYVHELQAQARKLKAEVAGLEASLLMSENYQGSINNPKNVQVARNSHPICKKIMQVDMFQVEERGYYAKIVCNKGEGMAASLYRALESLAGFNVQNSNLATVCESYLLTFTLNVKGSEPEINLPNLKLWVTGALLNQGFEFVTSFPA
ncbi:transcription factor FER-LIKE IRON DEFICIENCY-INDUCED TRANSCRIPTION FACTOR [Cajanus cajan]|uniref:Transcription factor FER-LIKE IRON DEFICIENCY-INDUCED TRANSCRIPTION FACTOR n=1 Tax=Cajanus cajan TaxID=3821 RepID=A0A151SAP0_CAJCA|nr:transcription factor FER-LIKE IRON DEFICIENCY-INDUCED TRANSCRIPTION FACTOR [Cajanus cajan]KYP51799.1 Transcription factor FER-LIKE IRON DEFICIENCY-INDUCED TRANSCRIPTION FACTOR [Cajanus cajan]